MTPAPLSIVCWRWRPPAGFATSFPVQAVNTLRRMVARHYRGPFRFVCVTDDPAGLDVDVEVVPIWNDFADIVNPAGEKKPSCYRRLRAFAPDIAEIFGPRFVSLDLDVVITGDVTELWNRSEPFVIYGKTHPTTPYNGSMFLLTAGARPQVWEQFDPARSPQLAWRAGYFGSDQGWISLCLGPGEPRWGRQDGVYSYPLHLQNVAPLPDNTRIVIMHGKRKPWDASALERHRWIQEWYQ